MLLEEGNDFLLRDEGGQSACVSVVVIAAGGHLINADHLDDGALVSVFGAVDWIADARADARTAHARGAMALAVRSGGSLPLLVRSLDK